jgi:uncharacterized membrane protein YfcA
MIGFLVIAAFLCEYIDSSLGMGYGTTLTPLLLLMGFTPLQIVPVILLSELVTGLMAGIFHHHEGNIDLREPTNLKLATVFGICGTFGAMAAVSLAVTLPEIWVKRYIAVLIFGMGVFMMAMRNRQFVFSWKGIVATGLLASFNKGMSGGGYGPLVCSGQIFSGVSPKVAVAITSVAESIVCLVGFILYGVVSSGTISWAIAPYIVLGATLSVPLAAKTVRRINERGFRLLVALATLGLGSFMFWKDVLVPIIQKL